MEDELIFGECCFTCKYHSITRNCKKREWVGGDPNPYMKCKDFIFSKYFDNERVK
jgi:hypothetical protein